MHRLLLSLAVILIPLSTDAALKKQCKPELYVDAEVPIKAIRVVIVPKEVQIAKNSAIYQAQEKWKKWVIATHGVAFGDSRLADGYKISCEKKFHGSWAGVLCSASAKPCRNDDALEPIRERNQRQAPTRK